MRPKFYGRLGAKDRAKAPPSKGRRGESRLPVRPVSDLLRADCAGDEAGIRLAPGVTDLPDDVSISPFARLPLVAQCRAHRRSAQVEVVQLAMSCAF